MTDEYGKLDDALRRVSGNPANNYHDILELLIVDIVDMVPGTTLLCADLFARAMALNPLLQPKEKRVMGAVVRKLHALDLIEPTGNTIVSTKKRSHGGGAREWRVV